MKPLGGDSWQITCVSQSSEIVMQDLAYGDSVAVDGVCLTVEEVLKDGFIATASPETLRRTTLGGEQSHQKYASPERPALSVAEGSRRVNLETSLRVGSKVGGHFVMGHVDGVGRLLEAQRTASSWEMTFWAPEAIARYIVPKGSIAVNGISLTVAAYEPESSQFTVAVIPLTYAETNLGYLTSGDPVNLEGDILGKYVEKFLNPGNHQPKAADEITPGFLAEHGYV